MSDESPVTNCNSNRWLSKKHIIRAAALLFALPLLAFVITSHEARKAEEKRASREVIEKIADALNKASSTLISDEIRIDGAHPGQGLSLVVLYTLIKFDADHMDEVEAAEFRKRITETICTAPQSSIALHGGVTYKVHFSNIYGKRLIIVFISHQTCRASRGK